MTTLAAWTVAPRSPTNRPRNSWSLPSSMVISPASFTLVRPEARSSRGGQHPANHGVSRLPCPVRPLRPHWLVQFHPGEPRGPVAWPVAGPEVHVVQLDLDQPPHEQLERRKLGVVQRPHLALPGVLGQRHGRGPELLGGGRHVDAQLGRAPARALLDRLVAGLLA